MPATIDLGTLDGTNGFRIEEIYDSRGFTSSVAGAGDFNGDGFDDLIIGASTYDLYGESGVDAFRRGPGVVYVLFGGRDAFAAARSPDARLGGVTPGDSFGGAIDSAGDLNGDGFGEIIVGASGYGARSTGAAYVLFGSPDGELSIMDAFRVDGSDASDYNGRDVGSAGDVNGDGLGDLIIGASGAGLGGANGAGAAYVVFGSINGLSGSIQVDALDGGNGFRLAGIDVGDRTGRSVSGAGDVNGDGIDDVLVGADAAGAGVYSDAGETFVVFGTTEGFPASVELSSLDGTDGFRLDGPFAAYQSGLSVSNAGDVNGDGVEDIVIGAPGAEPNGRFLSGASYVVFGSREGFSSSLNLSTLDGTDGFRLAGADVYDSAGLSVSGGGDINGDGFDDLIMSSTASNVDGLYRAGAVYVVFGGSGGFSKSLILSALDGTNGFRIDGHVMQGRVGSKVSAAEDVNGDGFDDLIINARFTEPAGEDPDTGQTNRYTGDIHVVFGFDSGGVDQAGGDGADVLVGGGAAEVLIGGGGDDRLEGGGGADVLRGAVGDDVLVVGDDGFRRVQGGHGSDTLELGFTGGALDLRGAAVGTRIESVEAVDLGDGGNAVTLDRLGVLRLSDVQNTLAISGGASDEVTLTDGGDWTLSGTDDGFDVYTNGAATLRLASAVALVALQRPAAPTDADATPNVLSEDVAVGVTVGLTASAVDPDAGDEVRYSLLDDASGLFEIDAVTGVVTLVGPLDFELAEAHEITVVASDAIGAGAPTTFTIEVANVLEVGTNRSEIMKGTDQDDRLDGRSGDDDLRGRGGDDLLIGGPGADSLDGGDGTDTASYAASPAGVTVNLLNGFNLGDAAGDRLISIENVTGSAHVDVLIGDAGANRLIGGDGADMVYGGAGQDLLDGGEGDDRLYGGNLDDVLAGGADDDLAVGDAGADTMTGGEGDDRLYGGSGDDAVEGEAGADMLAGSSGDDDLDGGDGNDRLYGGGDDDVLAGGAGFDLVVGGAGADRIEGGADPDRLYGQAGADMFVFAVGSNSDRIFDFEDDIDTIQVAAAFGFADGAALFAASYASGDHAVVNLGGGDTIKLVGYLASHALADLADDLAVF